ncbi:unnamed protein product [Leptidea sinapis]|uniref:Uncharacterized protein n=1 Tax=Leptidea sinapis TaxID=189913 RepID=A0A5E4PR60_9NEOP|nr:unnamed protein product [Leptidea sinapis]
MYLPTQINTKAGSRAILEFLESNLNLNVPLKTKEEVDDACLYIKSLIQVAAWSNSPELKDTSRVASVPLAVKEKIAAKRRLRRIWQTTHKPEDKTRLNQAIKELKYLLDDALLVSAKNMPSLEYNRWSKRERSGFRNSSKISIQSYMRSPSNNDATSFRYSLSMYTFRNHRKPYSDNYNWRYKH